MNLKKTLAAMAAIATVTAGAAFAQTADEIVQKSHDVKEPAFTHSAVQMDLIEANGTTESRMVEEWGRSANGLKSVVMVFHSPATVKDTRFLQVENAGRDADKWIYLPALRTTRRVASSEGSKSFMGTDATYDDMGDREVAQDTHELAGEETVGQYSCWKIKSSAKDPADSQYAYRISWIDKASYVPVKVEMYDKKGALLKVLTVDKLEQTNGYWIPMIDNLKNVQTGHSTKLSITKIEIDKPLSDKLFTSNFLNTGRL